MKKKRKYNIGKSWKKLKKEWDKFKKLNGKLHTNNP